MKNHDTVMRKVSELKPAEYNPRKISKKEYDKLRKSIEEFGLTQPLMVNMKKGRENIVIGGHQRLSVLRDLGVEEVYCVEMELSLKKEKELNIKMNRTGGEFDMDILLEEFEMDDLSDWGFEKGELPSLSPNDDQKDLSDDIDTEYKLEIDCKDEQTQQELYERLIEEGFTCRILTL